MLLWLVSALFAMVVGYLVGKTRSRDRLPREVYGKDGRRIL